MTATKAKKLRGPEYNISCLLHLLLNASVGTAISSNWHAQASHPIINLFIINGLDILRRATIRMDTAGILLATLIPTVFGVICLISRYGDRFQTYIRRPAPPVAITSPKVNVVHVASDFSISIPDVDEDTELSRYASSIPAHSPANSIHYYNATCNSPDITRPESFDDIQQSTLQILPPPPAVIAKGWKNESRFIKSLRILGGMPDCNEDLEIGSGNDGHEPWAGS